MPIPQDARDLADLLQQHPLITAAWFARRPNGRRYILAQTAHLKGITHHSLPVRYRGLGIQYQQSPPIYPLIVYDPITDQAHPHQTCQNEPIQLGTQIQPHGADWVGTAGAPCHWQEPDGHHYGILSNWHVMHLRPGPDLGRTQHQPTAAQSAIATLADHRPPDPNATNLIDAAIADAYINGFHTIDRRIIGIGPTNADPIDARPGSQAIKSGRTTGVTEGRCVATGAAVWVSYPKWDALFADQDLYQPAAFTFSAPGDSGSLILSQPDLNPMSLLFAGGGDLTVGNPIRHVADALGIDFNFRP